MIPVKITKRHAGFNKGTKGEINETDFEIWGIGDQAMPHYVEFYFGRDKQRGRSISNKYLELVTKN